MIGRFLLGAGLGALVGTGLLAMASLMTPQPGGAPAPKAVAEKPPEAGVTPEAAPAPDPAPEPLAEAAPEGAEAVPLTPQDAPKADESAAAPVPAEPAAADAPSVAGAPAAPAGEAEPEAPPAADASAPAPAVAPSVADAPVAPVPAVVDEMEPEAPLAAEGPAVASAPAAPAGLDGDDVPAPAEVPSAAPAAVGAAAPEAPAVPGSDEAGPAAPGDLAEAAPPASGPARPEAPLAEAALPGIDPAGLPPLTPEEEEMLARIAAEGPGSALPPGEAAPDAAGAPAEQPSLLTEREDDKVLRPEESGSTLPPSPALAGTEEGVTTGRLPSIGDAAEVPAETPAETVVDTRPIAAFAEAFDNPEAKPAFAIVLIDEGAAETDRAALAALPFPVTFALDPSDPKAADYAAVYRAAGKEVAMLASALPKGAEAADIEVALSAMTAVLPEAVAVMDLPSRAFQGDRPLSTLVVPVVGAGGRGLLTWDQGLNAADQVARREDIPAAVAFRDLDGEGESAPVIRRYLDRAVFKAAQEGHVTVIGRTRPETVAALLEWAVEGRAATVALAPLTAVLSVD